MATSSTSGSGLGGDAGLVERRRRRSGDPRKRDPKAGPDARKARARFGSTTPRLFTAPLVSGDPGPCGCGCALTDASTFGFEAVRFAEEVVKFVKAGSKGRPHMPARKAVRSQVDRRRQGVVQHFIHRASLILCDPT